MKWPIFVTAALMLQKVLSGNLIGSIQQFLVDRLDRSALTEGRISTLLTIQVALSSTIRVLTVYSLHLSARSAYSRAHSVGQWP